MLKETIAIKCGVWLLLIIAISISCKDKQPTRSSSVEAVPVNMKQLKKGLMADLFSKVELLPLETTDEAIVSHVIDYEYVKDAYHIVTDKNFRIHVFDKNGKLISHSAGIIGQGPEEYWTLIDVFYNPLTKTIEVLTAEKTVMSYDSHFKFVEKKRIANDVKELIQYACPISKDVYLLLPSFCEGGMTHVFFYDFKKQAVVKDVVLDHPAKLNGVKQHFRRDGSELYITPNLSAFSGYRVNQKTYELEPLFQLDFGPDNMDLALMKKKYPNGLGVSAYEQNESVCPMPMETWFNNQYIVSAIEQQGLYSTFVYNRETKESKLLEREYTNKQLSADYYTLDGSSLLAISLTAYMDVFVDTTLLDEANKAIWDAIDYDDNPVVIRYTLR